MTESKLVIIKMDTTVKENEYKILNYLETSDQDFLFLDSSSESSALVHSS